MCVRTIVYHHIHYIHNLGDTEAEKFSLKMKHGHLEHQQMVTRRSDTLPMFIAAGKYMCQFIAKMQPIFTYLKGRWINYYYWLICHVSCFRSPIILQSLPHISYKSIARIARAGFSIFGHFDLSDKSQPFGWCNSFVCWTNPHLLGLFRINLCFCLLPENCKGWLSLQNAINPSLKFPTLPSNPWLGPQLSSHPIPSLKFPKVPTMITPENAWRSVTPRSSQQWCGSALRPPAKRASPWGEKGEKIPPVIWQYQISSIIHLIWIISIL